MSFSYFKISGDQGVLSRRQGYQFLNMSYCIMWVIDQGLAFLASPGWWVWRWRALISPKRINLDEKVTTWNNHVRTAKVFHVNIYESKKTPLMGIV